MLDDVEDFLLPPSPRDDDIRDFVYDLISYTGPEYEPLSKILKKKYRINPSKHEIRAAYAKYFPTIKIPPKLTKWMVKKQMRSNSGVLVVTIVLTPDKFSCKYNCSYCPQETDTNGKLTQPRSYLSNEPAMRRALEFDFDLRGQFQNRIDAYKHTGNISENSSESSKIEVIFSGGTWESYPIEYREQVMLELYWAANTIEQKRESKTLEEEISENETTKYRIIGFTLETRPDNVTKETILQYRRWGVTRIQIGVQHYDDEILRQMNRKCYTEHTIKAIRLLKQAGLKVVVHLMPDLPGSSPEQDKWMFDQAITRPELQFDDVKLYPTAVVKAADEKHIVKSKIADMYAEGSYAPYSEKHLDDLLDVLIYYKTRLNPWVRIQRLVRDIPGTDIEAGYGKISNLRQILHNKMKKDGVRCVCIRCMEIGDLETENLTPLLVVRQYWASEGVEYHITLEAHKMTFLQTLCYYFICFLNYFVDGYWNGSFDFRIRPIVIAPSNKCESSVSSSYIGLYGFLRMRFDPEPGGDFIDEISNCALIREVHVYGTAMGIKGIGEGKGVSIGGQHSGYGKRLMATAEEIAKKYGWSKIAVIAGVGTREYYRKIGYTLRKTYMLKNL